MMRKRHYAQQAADSSSSSDDEDAFVKKKPKKAKKPAGRLDVLLQELQQHSNPPPAAPSYHQEPPPPRKKGSWVTPQEEHVTPNLFVGNLHPSVTEDALVGIFQRFGELHSVKIMWPRNEAERMRNRNTDAEKAMKHYANTDPFNVGRPLMLRWGRDMRSKEQQQSQQQPPQSYDSKEQRHRQQQEQNRPRRTEQLSFENQVELERLVQQQLSLSRSSICNAMVFCFEHGYAAKSICRQIHEWTRSAGQTESSSDPVVARLYLMSDILYNAQQPGVKHAFLFRQELERSMGDLFLSLGQQKQRLGRMQWSRLETAVQNLLQLWGPQWSVFEVSFMQELQNRFEGREHREEDPQVEASWEKKNESDNIDGAAMDEQLLEPALEHKDEDVDGEQIALDDLDGEPIEPESRQRDEEDLDGAAIELEDLDGGPVEMATPGADEEDLDGASLDEDDIDGLPMSDTEEQELMQQ